MNNFMEQIAGTATKWIGSSMAFVLAVASVVLWAVTGPFFDYSTEWQLIANTGTTLVTYVILFLIQRSQNKDAAALHMKLNEIIAAQEGASNRLINIEELSEDEIRNLHERYRRMSEKLKCEGKIAAAHSIEEEEESLPSDK